jgi:hypothetical protein
MDTEYLLKDFTYRELSEILDVKLQTLKRWGREFLAPDEDAGQQQGKARLLNIDDAFLLRLAKNLVSEQKFSIPDTKIIIKDLMPWLKSKGFLPTLYLKGKLDSLIWNIEIVRDRTNTPFRYRAIGEIHFTHEEVETENYQPPLQLFKTKAKAEYFIEEIGTDFSDLHHIDYGVKRKGLLPISVMLKMEFFGNVQKFWHGQVSI